MGLPFQSQEISLLQRRSGQECTESAEPELPCGKAKPEMGDRRNRVQLVWTEAVSLSCFGFAQRLSGQLYHFRPAGIGHGNFHAGEGI